MNKIIDIFKQKEKTLSFELFPPKTEKGYENLLTTIEQLSALKPDFISCTYGAGGGNRDKTFDIVQLLQEKYNIVGLAHLTCVLNTKEELKNILTDAKTRGIQNILALRGDPPVDNPDWQPGENNFKYSSELCAFICEHFQDYFGIAVAGFPEGHILCPDRNKDAEYLKLKFDNGADFVMTQLFFNNQDYFDYVKRLRKVGVKASILPGILPITNYQGLLKFTATCGATVTQEVKDIFEPIADDKEAVLKAGINFAVKQCQDLLAGGAPGLHFYTLNKISPVDKILSQGHICAAFPR
ncbi:5,10-methylenetetrahydrofolate reductase [hydrothermal vent metagenome]|uniref:methylenetetrahydrofolate reductase (NADH) n=1 Tax=hydrothermal vent metagenome TaxID=652676 RepID=A0A3B1D4B8_9ZZZZ